MLTSDFLYECGTGRKTSHIRYGKIRKLDRMPMKVVGEKDGEAMKILVF
jgi:hypothetical protein